MKIKNVGAFKVGDVVKLPRDSCGCCIDPDYNLGQSTTWAHGDYTATIISVNKRSGYIELGFAKSDKLPTGLHTLDAEDQIKYSSLSKYGCYVNKNVVCELIAPAKSSLTSSGSFGFLFACIGVGAGVSHYTCMQRNSPKDTEKSLTR